MESDQPSDLPSGYHYDYDKEEEYSLWKDEVIFVAEPLIGGGKQEAAQTPFKLKKRKKPRKLPTHCRSCPYTSIWLYATLACLFFQCIITGFSVITNIVLTGTIAVMILLCLMVVMYCTPLMHCHMKRYSLKSCLSIASLTSVIATMCVSQHAHDVAAFYDGNTVALGGDTDFGALHDADFLTINKGYIAKSKAAVSTESNLVCVAPVLGMGDDKNIKIFAVNFLDDCCGKFECPGWQANDPGKDFSMATVPALTWDDIPEELTIEINEKSIKAAVANAAKMGGFTADKEALFILWTEDQTQLQARNFKITVITLIATFVCWPVVIAILYPFKLLCCPTSPKAKSKGKKKSKAKKPPSSETKSLTQDSGPIVEDDPLPITM